MGPPPKFRGAPRYHNTRRLYMTDEGVDYDSMCTISLQPSLASSWGVYIMLLMAGVDDDTAQEEILDSVFFPGWGWADGNCAETPPPRDIL